MTIEIEIMGSASADEIYDLRNFLQEQEIQGLQLQLKEQASVDGTMSITEVACIVATIAGEMTLKAGLEMAFEKPMHKLAESIRAWLKKRKQEGKREIEIYTEEEGGGVTRSYLTNSNGVITELDNLNFAIDVKHTRVLLIGNSEFEFNFPEIKPVKGNLEDLYAILTDRKRVGIPSTNITVLLNKNSGEIEEQLLQISKIPDVETLIIYYAGHGYRADTKKLFLVARNSKKIDDHIISAIDFDFITNIILKRSTASQKIVILDACHSGIATQGGDDFLAGVDVKGTYIFASSSGDEVSYFNKDNRNTFFTGEMVDVFMKGLENNRENIALKDIYETVAGNLKERKFPEPRFKSDLNIPLSSFFIARNPMFSVEKWKQLARQLLASGKTEEALQEYNRMLRHFPDDESIKDEALKAEGERRYLEIVNKADELFREQEYEEAIKNYEEALKIKQEFSVLSRKNKCAEYLEVKRKLLAKNPDPPKTTTTIPVKNTELPLPGKKEKRPLLSPVANPVVLKTTEPIDSSGSSLTMVTKKNWWIAIIIHGVFFAIGLFYVNPGARRKWLYPLCLLSSAFIILLYFVGYKMVNSYNSFLFRILFLGGVFTGYIIGGIDCLLTLSGRIKMEKPGQDSGGINSAKDSKAWIYIISILWGVIYLFVITQIIGRWHLLFNCPGCTVPYYLYIDIYIFTWLPLLIVFLLLRENKSGWILAILASTANFIIVISEALRIADESNSIGKDWIRTPLLFLLMHGFLIYALNRPDVRNRVGLNNKTRNGTLIFSYLFIIVFIRLSGVI